MDIESQKLNVKDLRNMLGLTMAGFGKKYNIPLRTIEDWERGVRHPPQYVVELLGRCVVEDLNKERELKNMAEKEVEEKAYSPVYRENVMYAREHGEFDACRASKKLNDDCCGRIEEVIRNNYDGIHLNKDSVLPVIEEFGAERVGYVLAATVLYKNWDARFSPDNRIWAENTCPEIVKGMYATNPVQLVQPSSTVNSHPAILNGFINMFRQEVVKIEQVSTTKKVGEEENLLNGKDSQFGIYQINEDGPGRGYMYFGSSLMEKFGFRLNGADYNLIYSSHLSDADLSERAELERIYQKFNLDRPSEFTGHSLSVSDVVLVNHGGDVKAYMVDSIGFEKLPDFVMERKQMISSLGEITAEKSKDRKDETQEEKSNPDESRDENEHTMPKRKGR